MRLSNKKGVQKIVITLAELGLKEVVICPGSRNAPLVISFNRHPNFLCTSVRDERSAGFYALGKAIETKKPIALLCTSGSASLNFAPAIVEAYYQRIPLIVLTADRPKEWTDQGDGQTINQTEIYKNYIRASYELNGDSFKSDELIEMEHLLSEGFHKATVSNIGPVHFNIPMDEPLYETEETEGFKSQIYKYEDKSNKLTESELANLSEQFSSFDKIMILVGQSFKNQELAEALTETAKNENVIVLSESISNVHHPLFVENIDRCITNLTQSEIEKLKPDLLITIGGAIISKRIKKLLRTHKPAEHWNIHPFDAEMNTYRSLTKSISMQATDFFGLLNARIVNKQSDYQKRWQELKKEKKGRHDTFCKDLVYSDFSIFEKIYEKLPSDLQVHYSNSSPIRYAQLFDNTKIAETWCNRGTSGIDGCTSTAVGAASASPDKNFLLITGDVAFHYDLNALWNEKSIKNLKIIILNNGGGGIFRIIDGPNKIEERANFLETSMKSNAKEIATHYGWNYLAAKNNDELEDTLNQFFYKKTKQTILEIFTNPDENPKVFQAYWEFLNIKNREL